jgi:hypothetical protein
MTRLRTLLGVAALGVATAAVTIVFSEVSGKPSQAASERNQSGLSLANPNEPQAPAEPNGGARSADAAAQSAFAALRQPSTETDAGASVDSRALKVLGSAQRNWGVNPSLARVAYDGGGVRLLLVPGTDAVCLVSLARADQSTDGSSASCRPIDEATRSGFLSWGTPSSGSPWTMRGILPDGAHNVTVIDASGDVSAVAINEDGAFAMTLRSAPRLFTFTAKDGQLHSLL